MSSLSVCDGSRSEPMSAILPPQRQQSDFQSQDPARAYFDNY